MMAGRARLVRPRRYGFVVAALASSFVSGARAESITVPADIGIGPAAYYISGAVADDQPIHAGLKISVQAIIDQATIRQHEDRIPPSLRAQAESLTEVRYSPSIFIPDALIISPKIRHTGLYGVSFRPISLGVSLISAPRIRLAAAAGLLVTYAYLYSDLRDMPATHFLRPGIDLGGELEVGITQWFLVSLGWASGFYVPQGFGTFGLGAFGETHDWNGLQSTLWHFGQGFIKFHFRFPYTADL